MLPGGLWKGEEVCKSATRNDGVGRPARCQFEGGLALSVPVAATSSAGVPFDFGFIGGTGKAASRSCRRLSPG